MSLSDPVLTVCAEHDSLAASIHDPLTFSFDDRHWRVRGLESQLSCERLKVNLLVTRQDLTHIDTVDLYTSRQRRMFLREAAAELYVDEALLKRDLGRVLLDLEQRQEALIKDTLQQQQEPDVPPMTEAERDEALQFLKDPQLTQQILADYEACGLVGEATNKLVCYLAGTSRLLDRPLSVLVQSSSGAGKTSLLEATLRFMPSEAQLFLSALTGQSLYYMGQTALKHKILAVAEEAGASEASYALKLLQSDGELRIASTERDSGSRRQQTRQYAVEGPVAMLLTTTAEHPDPELANRCILLRVNEQPAQTAAIHARQREAYTWDAAPDRALRIQAQHQRAQRLLEPLGVTIPWATQLTFHTDQTRTRREHANYLALIASITLLHQYQRRQVTGSHQGQVRKHVVATLEDVALANQLAQDTLGARRDALLPQTRQLLIQLVAYVHRRAEQASVAPVDLCFTQRELREQLGWQDRTLRRHLSRLVELEYVLMRRTGLGNQRAYQLAADVPVTDSAVSLSGLIDVARLRQDATN